MEIPIGIVGRVANSSQRNHFVRVAHDVDGTNGYLIFEWWDGSNGPNENQAFDGWVKDREDLVKYFEESNWEVVWQ